MYKSKTDEIVIAPVLFALAFQMDLVFGSKWLITQFNCFGFCVG